MSLLKSFKKPLLVVLILGFALLVFSYMKNSKPTMPPAEIKERVWVVQTQRLEAGNHSPTTELYGTVQSSKKVTISASATGVLQLMSVKSGDFVAQGEPMFALNETDISIPVAQAKSDVADLKTQVRLQKMAHQVNLKRLDQEKQIYQIKQETVDRNSRLLAKDLSSQSALDAAKEALVRQEYTVNSAALAVQQNGQKLAQLNARLDKAKQGLQKAQLAAERAVLKAPYDLRVASVQVSEGDLLTQNKPILSFYALDSLELKAKLSVVKVPEVLAMLEKEKALTALVDWQGASQQLSLLRLDGEADTSGLFAYFEVPTSLTGMRIGTLLSVDLLEPEVSNSFLVPFSAMYGNDRLYVVKQGRLSSRNVTLHGQKVVRGQTLAIVTGDIKAGDSLLVTHLPNATDQLKVVEAQQ